MSRYGDYSPRSPPVERWNPERFERERGGRKSSVVERDRFQERDTYSNSGFRRRESSADDFYHRSGPSGGTYEDDRFYDREERYGPPAPLPQRNRGGGREVRYHEEDYEVDSYDDGPTRGGRDQRYHEEDRRFSSGRGPRPPRPGQLIRRQSSLDTFDRKPNRPRYGPPRQRSPEVIPMRGPRKDRHSPPRYQDRDTYEDIRISDQDRYGDENFHGWKEREIETIRRRRRSSSPKIKERDVIHEETLEEKPYPRRGKTKMSARLVNKRAIIDMGYPFEEDYTAEGQFVIILKALNKELIDEVLFRSKEYNERERERITYAIDAPPPPPPSNRGEVIERREIIIDKSPEEVPRSVREWDVMSGAIDNKSTHGGAKSTHGGAKSTHGGKSQHGGGKSEHHNDHLSTHESTHKSSHSRRKSRGRSASRTEMKTSKASRSRSHSHSSGNKQLVIERKPSHKHHSRHRSHGRKAEYVETDEVGESNKMHTGPLAMVLSAPTRTKSKSRRDSDRAVKDEIRELELEKERLRRERRRERRYHRQHTRRSSSSSSSSSSGSGGGEVIIERKGSHGRTDDYKIKENKRGGGDSRIVKGMLATLT